jgi:uncharacterized protein YfaS (alpha-2-macroglobulin family)
VPNFFVEATVVAKGKVHVEACELLVLPVQELLQVRIKTDKEIYRPGEGGAVRIAVTDAAGKPVSGQVTLTAYDMAVTYIQQEMGAGPGMLIAKRKVEHQPDQDLFSRGWGLQGQGTFVCPEFEIYDEGHRMIGGMGGAGPQGGDPSDSSPTAARARRGPGGERQAGGPAEPVIRRDFADTALWRAALDLGPDGTARANLPWPQSLTTWRLRAYTLTEATQVGDASAEVVTSKNLLVRLQTPRFLVEGDAVVLSANVHNALPRDQRVTAELIVPAALLSAPQATPAASAGNLRFRAERVVKAGGSERFDWPLRVVASGTAAITVKAVAQQESDAMQVTVPVLPYGIRQEMAQAGALQAGDKATQTVTLTLPEKFDPERTRLEVSLAPGPLGAMLDALPMLIGYPHGCTEQTMSRFYPTIIVANTLKKLGINLEALARVQRHGQPPLADRFQIMPAPVYDSVELRRMAEVGLERLYNFQHEDGGWGWWRDDASSPYMTAYVLMGLQVTLQAGLEVRPRALEHGYDYLFQTIDPQQRSREPLGGPDELETEAYIAYVLQWAAAHTGKPGGFHPARFSGAKEVLLKRLRGRLWDQRGRLSPYGQVLLALALHHGREEGRAGVVLQELLRHVQQDDKDGTAHVPTEDHGWWHWWNSDIETNAWLLRAVVRIDPRNDLASRLARWLVLHRPNGVYWRSTRDSALAVAALADYLEVQKAMASDGRAIIRLDGRVIRELTLTPDNLLALDLHLVLDGGQLTPGTHALTVQKTGRGDLYYACRLRAFAKQDALKAAGKGLVLQREYIRRAADGSHPTPLAAGDAVAVGDLVEVVLTIDADNYYDYLAFEDAKPAGCEPVQLQSGGLWLDWCRTNVELRDDRVAFYVARLHRGQHKLRYVLRAETPGVFRVLPAVGFAMYAPEIQASSAGWLLRVRDK